MACLVLREWSTGRLVEPLLRQHCPTPSVGGASDFGPCDHAHNITRTSKPPRQCHNHQMLLVAMICPAFSPSWSLNITTYECLSEVCLEMKTVATGACSCEASCYNMCSLPGFPVQGFPACGSDTGKGTLESGIMVWCLRILAETDFPFSVGLS